VIERAVEAGVERIMVPGWDVASSEAALALAERHPTIIQASVGVHPHYAARVDEGAWHGLEALIADSRCSAVGEIGLDFHRNLSPPDQQRSTLERQLELAARRGLPVLVHDREAHAEITSALIGRTATTDSRGVLHAYSGDAQMAETLTGAGYFVSFALPISFRSAVGPRAAAASIEAGSYLLETDAPYLGPQPDGRNEPTTTLRVAVELARLRETAPEIVAREARAAYDRLFAT
jgi:TatD DNase family protein